MAERLGPLRHGREGTRLRDGGLERPAGYDVFYAVFTAPTSIPPGSASMSQLSQVECQNANSGMPNEDYTFGHEIEANRTIYVQVMSVCANRIAFARVRRRREGGGAPVVPPA